MKKSFIIPVTYAMCAEVEVYANTLEEAIAEVDDGPLPTDGEYVDGSFEINHDMIPFLNGVDDELEKVENEG